MSESVEKWGMFEIALQGPGEGNPFTEVAISARFECEASSFTVPGFYDGDGTYRVRCMPDRVGRWTFVTTSACKALDGKVGSFDVTEPTPANHGPVRVANTFHFQYADGTPYRQIGTTAYAWTHQPEALEHKTLAALKAGPFNKIRMCVFPKNYAFTKSDPPRFPFEGAPPDQWNYTRFNPEFFQHFEKRIGQLLAMNIQADVILLHPYDEGRWGFDRMDQAADERYLRYVIARLAAYRNVWWSMANEHDFMKLKPAESWDEVFRVVVESDPFNHLRSIHNGFKIYDHNKPWVSHVSLQNGSAVEDFGRATLYRDVWNKPVVFDEVKYEGNLPQRWGNISAQEMVHRFWQGTIGGTYVGHGETYLHPQDIIWWARGGELHGKSPARLKFLRDVLEDSPAKGIDPIDKWQDLRTAGQPGEYYIVYFGKDTPAEWLFELPRQGLAEGMTFKAEILDTWDMTVTAVPGEFKIVTDTTYRYHAKGHLKIKLPAKPWIAIRLKRKAGDAVQLKEGEKIYGES